MLDLIERGLVLSDGGMAMRKKRERGRPVRGMTLARVFPFTSSMVRKWRPSASSTEKIVTM
jgi:hypothetical protein